MIRRELKVNLKSFILWTSILLGIFLIVYAIYPFIITDESIKSIDEMMEIFPPEVLKAFNMDLTSISTTYGWLKSEGFMFVLIIIGLYSSTLGMNIVLKEESDKTIEYLESLPIKRSRIVTNKIIVSVIYILLMIVAFGLFNYVALSLSGEFDKIQFLLLSVTPLLIALPLFSLNLFLSTFFHKTKRTFGISMGLVFIFYILSILSELSSNVEFLKYFSIYTLADTRNVITNISINPVMIIISSIITLVFIVLSHIKYSKKELVG